MNTPSLNSFDVNSDSLVIASTYTYFTVHAVLLTYSGSSDRLAREGGGRGRLCTSCNGKHTSPININIDYIQIYHYDMCSCLDTMHGLPSKPA